MDVSIIFVNYKSKDITINAIQSVIEKTEDIEYEIFVVDNNSQDGSIEAIEQLFPNIKIIKNPINAGFGVANNLAIKQANGKYIFCLNTDTLLVNNAIKIMFDFMEHNQDFGACGGNLYHQDMTPAYSCAPMYNAWNCSALYWLLKLSFKKFFCPKEIKSLHCTDMVSGADLFLRKSILEKVGLFDENIFMYSEDMDLCKRINDSGYKNVIVPEAKIIHLEGRNKNNFLKRTQTVVTGKYYFLRKHKLDTTRIIMQITYFCLHFICLFFTFNKEHLKLLKIHFKG